MPAPSSVRRFDTRGRISLTDLADGHEWWLAERDDAGRIVLTPVRMTPEAEAPGPEGPAAGPLSGGARATVPPRLRRELDVEARRYAAVLARLQERDADLTRAIDAASAGGADAEEVGAILRNAGVNLDLPTTDGPDHALAKE